ncbi:transposase [Thermodesulfobacteriota bacterium]
MARQWRIEYPGALYHVLSRGNGRQDIFLTDDDRHLFLNLIEELSERFNIEMYAYVLMSNHYHLLLKTADAILSKAMQWLGTGYTRKFNINNHTGGHLFQGRYKCIIVENDIYILRLSCYIHRNPQRAGNIDRLAEYEGYWNRPEATCDTIKDGWLHTGDMGKFDEEGYLYVVDRVKDMILSGGENVYPAEIERVIREMPGVADVSVIGVPDEKWGEIPKAFIEKGEEEPPGPEEVIAFCRSKLAGYKVPKLIECIDELPRNPSGKVLKKNLRALDA